MKKGKGYLVISWAAVVVMAVIIFLFSCNTGERLQSGFGIASQLKLWIEAALSAAAGRPIDASPIGHFVEYLIFGALILNAIAATPQITQALCSSTAKLITAATCLASIYGITDELHQLFVPGRACDPADWLVDTIAALLGTLIMLAILKSMKKNQNTPRNNPKTY